MHSTCPIHEPQGRTHSERTGRATAWALSMPTRPSLGYTPADDTQMFTMLHGGGALQISVAEYDRYDDTYELLRHAHGRISRFAVRCGRCWDGSTGRTGGEGGLSSVFSAAGAMRGCGLSHALHGMDSYVHTYVLLPSRLALPFFVSTYRVATHAVRVA